MGNKNPEIRCANFAPLEYGRSIGEPSAVISTRDCVHHGSNLRSIEMSHDSLSAPWRMEYIRSLEQPDNGCFLCAACGSSSPDELRTRLVLWQTGQSIVLINKFPYTNGHLLVAPCRHVADLEELTSTESADLQVQCTEAVKLLKRVLSPQGFNIGMNLGRAAGAGLPGHLHQHIVPRWGGDTNFVSVVGQVRIVPQAMEQLWQELSAHILPPCPPTSAGSSSPARKS